MFVNQRSRRLWESFIEHWESHLLWTTKHWCRHWAISALVC